MGFELGVVVVGPLAPERIVPVTRQLLERWPWLRLPKHYAHARQVLLASVERTSYMVEAGRHAQSLDAFLERDLVACSRELDDAAIAWIHTDCFGGHCVDDGFVARGGARVCTSSSLSELLGHVGIETSGFFAAFERGHFGANVDPREFVACLPSDLREELDELERDDPCCDPDDLAWLPATLDELHADFDELERGLVAALDQRFDDGQALHVLADALALAGDPRGELLALSLAGERARMALLAPLEQQLATLERATPPHHLLIDDWWPRLWTSWSGPFVTRLVVHNAVRLEHSPVPFSTAWTPDAARKHLRTLLELPCARYLSPRRVTLLSCPLQRDLRGHDLSGFELGSVDLRGAKLAASRFHRSSLAKALLGHADLRDADLRDADLRDADLRSADLRGATLLGADLRDADLRFADLRGARLDGGVLLSARSEGVAR